MDVYCPKCGEPWENDTIHDRVVELGLAEPFYLPSTDRFSIQREKNPAYDTEKSQAAYRKLAAEFRSKGCVVLGGTCSEPSGARDNVYGLTAQDAAAALYDVLGDDMDGAASILADMGY